MSGSAGLRWTGHALADVGVAGVCAFVKKKDPEAITLDDLDQVSDFLSETYYEEKLGTFLTCVFMNASFVQPNEKAPKRKLFVERYLRAHRAPPDPVVAGQRCVFSGLPATSPLVRTHLPLFSGEGVINFRPDGSSWVPVSGPFVVALFFLPMASRRAEGKLLCVHSEGPDLTLDFARRYLADNRRLLGLALPSARSIVHEGYDRELPSWNAQKKRYKFADAKGPRSLVVADLGSIADEALESNVDVPAPSSATAYLLNSGKGPSLDVFDIPGGIVSFVLRASGASTARAWKAVSSRFRPVKDSGDEEGPSDGKKKLRGRTNSNSPPGRPGWSKNPAFEDLCGIYTGGFLDRSRARTWISRYVLGRMGLPDRPRFEATQARLWALADLFLKEVLAMKQTRIDAIRTFADKVAGWISDQRSGDGKKLLYSVLREKPSDLRRKLVRSIARHPDRPPFFTLDEFCLVWLDDDRDAWLVQDLIAIRVIERLHQLEHFREVAQDLSIDIDATQGTEDRLLEEHPQ